MNLEGVCRRCSHPRVMHASNVNAAPKYPRDAPCPCYRLVNDKPCGCTAALDTEGTTR